MEKLCSLKTVKRALREKYAWPGGYPLYLICADGETLSIDGARECWRQICAAHISKDYADKQWGIIAVDINYDDPYLYCIHTSKPIEVAYADY